MDNPKSKKLFDEIITTKVDDYGLTYNLPITLMYA